MHQWEDLMALTIEAMLMLISFTCYTQLKRCQRRRKKRMNTRRGDCLSSPNCPAWQWCLCRRADSCIHSWSSLHNHVWRQFTGSFGWRSKWMSRVGVFKQRHSDFEMNSQQEEFSINCSNLHCLKKQQNASSRHLQNIRKIKNQCQCWGSLGSGRKMGCVWSAGSGCTGQLWLQNKGAAFKTYQRLCHAGHMLPWQQFNLLFFVIPTTLYENRQHS